METPVISVQKHSHMWMGKTVSPSTRLSKTNHVLLPIINNRQEEDLLVRMCQPYTAQGYSNIHRTDLHEPWAILGLEVLIHLVVSLDIHQSQWCDLGVQNLLSTPPGQFRQEGFRQPGHRTAQAVFMWDQLPVIDLDSDPETNVAPSWRTRIQ